MALINGDTNMKTDGDTNLKGPVAGVYLDKAKEKISIYQAMKKRLLKPATALVLLEAQAATVGIIDPVANKTLPVSEAIKEGIVGPEMREKLLAAENALHGYKDPYSDQTISLFQAMQKEIVTKEYGLRLLEAQIATKGLFDPNDKAWISTEEAVQKGLYQTDLLNNQMPELKVIYNPNSQEKVNYKSLMEKCIVDTDTGLLLFPVYITFKGLRRGISSTELLESKIIDKETFDDLQRGKTTTEDVMLLESVKEYLEGKGSIAGIAILSDNKRMSIYQAMKKGILMPGTALVLLEAQAATGFMIDPVENKIYTVDGAIKNKLVGPEFHAKLRSAERAVTGYKDPYTGETISLFQALSKDLIVKDHGIRLLEAQIATGGIIDPINSHRLPTEIAFKRGYFNKDMHTILEDSGDDTKGFFDPNTEDNLTYLQLMERCVIDPITGLCLLGLQDKKGINNFIFIDYDVKLTFKQEMVNVTYGKYAGLTVSLWALLMSEYFDEHERRDIIQKYKEGTLTIKTIVTMVLEKIEKSVKTTELVFEGIRETVTGKQLVEADIISAEVLDNLKKGKTSVKELTQDESVNVYLQGKECIAGVLLPNSQIMRIYQAREARLLMPGTALILLEAQAATGFIIDPIRNKRFSVDDAVRAKIVGPDVWQKLRSAEKAVTGYINPYDDQKISLFQAMQKDLIIKEHGIRLLEAQIATGGIIDPVNSLRIPVHVAYKRGYFNEEMNQILLDPSDDTKGFFDPNTHENLTYLQLLARKGYFDEEMNNILNDPNDDTKGFFFPKTSENLTYLDTLNRCVKDESTGLYLLPINDKPKAEESKVYTLEEIKKEFEKISVNVKIGRYAGKSVSLWELIHSRKDVSVTELFESKIINEDLYKDLNTGKLTVDEVSEMESVRRYLEGTNSIAGVYLQSTKETLSIYEAKQRGLLTPGTSLVLLEAQAATGFVIDPVKNKKLSVEDAAAQGVVGSEWKNKLLSAERAVTGYKDPYTDKMISLFQALKKDLIVKDHGVRLLEAQIATGGIIDPVYSHRVPVQVAYQRGYFDEEINQILSDPDDDTKGFFDPNTHENLTYLQLVERKDVSVTELFESKIINEDLYKDLNTGKLTVDEVSEMESVRRYLEGTNSIAGVYLQSTKETLSIYEAKQRGLLTPGTSLVLLEAQAATGFVIDPVKNKKLSVEDAAAQGVVGSEWKNKLLSAERAVTGYKDPYTDKMISLFQALKKDLIVKDHGVRLLEAQIATGGIIDPVYSHRVPVQVAYQRGYFDEEINQILSDPDDDTKGFFDPNTHEKT
uniref:Plectin n=1 Tax=Knipowitschia caucasica TaxID=637954 RepID=A0AAV2K2Q7_KNICA